ncbi:hypothetical protein HK102_004272 [Quaeritorhiza haematococci]|nr:hypothetical protein HK102_004272 [Quaeritorhiza haematococci]
MRVFAAFVALASVAALSLHSDASPVMVRPVDVRAQQAPEQLSNPAESMPEETVNEPTGPEQDMDGPFDEMDMYAPDAVADEEGYPFAEYPEWMETAATDDEELSAAGRSYGRGFGYGGLKGYQASKEYRGFKGFIVKRVGPKKGSFGKSCDIENSRFSSSVVVLELVY